MKGVSVVLFLFLLVLNPAVGQNDEEQGKQKYLDRGSTFFGVSLGLDNGIRKNQDLLGLIEFDELETHKFLVRGSGGYFLKNMMAVGMTAGYNQFRNKIDRTDDNNQSVKYRTNGREYMLSPFLRSYIPLSSDGRWSLFSHTHLSIGFGATETFSQTANTLRQTYKRYGTFDLGMKPGILAFIKEGVAFEASVGFLGLSSEYGRTKENGKSKGENLSADINFEIDILQISFGLFYYF